MRIIFDQPFGMQANTILHIGSSFFKSRTVTAPEIELYHGNSGYQTGYVFLLDNLVRFTKEIKITIEHSLDNHLANEMSNTAYWYAKKPMNVD